MTRLTIDIETQLDGQHWERLEDELATWLHDKDIEGEITNEATGNSTRIESKWIAAAYDMEMEEWEEKYRPICHLGMVYPEDGLDAILFDVKQITADVGTTWSLIEEDGLLWIESGMRYVNRLVFFITEKPYEVTGLIIKI